VSKGYEAIQLMGFRRMAENSIFEILQIILSASNTGLLK
jgi:hypothetical protein